MIRNFKKEDIDIVMQIWLNTNIDAHSFISKYYWINNFDAVKAILPKSEVYVYENDIDNAIQGFVGVDNDYISGVFVCSGMQSKGIGRQLLVFLKNIKNQLKLSVYQKNKRAIKFYRTENFKIQSENIDQNTGEKEYFMQWER